MVARIGTRWTYFESSPDQSLADRVGLAGNGRVPALKIAGGFQEMSDGLAIVLFVLDGFGVIVFS